jgi:cytoskeleton protein RodZ
MSVSRCLNQSAHRKWLLPLVALSVPAIVALALYVWFEFWPASPQVVEVQSRRNPTRRRRRCPSVRRSRLSSHRRRCRMWSHCFRLKTLSSLSMHASRIVRLRRCSRRWRHLPGQRQLAFTFATDSWVEMRDASDAILFSELNRSGSTRTFNATFPVSLVIGNARSVTLHIDGVPYDLAPSTKVDVARLRLE